MPQKDEKDVFQTPFLEARAQSSGCPRRQLAQVSEKGRKGSVKHVENTSFYSYLRERTVFENLGPGPPSSIE